MTKDGVEVRHWLQYENSQYGSSRKANKIDLRDLPFEVSKIASVKHKSEKQNSPEPSARLQLPLLEAASFLEREELERLADGLVHQKLSMARN